jgi:AbrB family looped-hinge helix DNA binding protein
MTAHIYGRGQMVIPSKARKEAGIDSGDVVLVESNGDGRILLTRLERPKPGKHANARLVRRKGRHSVITGTPEVNLEQINRILRDEFP